MGKVNMKERNKELQEAKKQKCDIFFNCSVKYEGAAFGGGDKGSFMYSALNGANEFSN